MSLDNVGNAARDSGRQDEALAAYRESLEIKRQLDVLEKHLPNTPGQL